MRTDPVDPLLFFFPTVSRSGHRLSRTAAISHQRVECPSVAAKQPLTEVGEMESHVSDAVPFLARTEERDGCLDLEHLPPLLEDEENVSLADLLSLRDRCLSEEEVWAVCAECVLALQSIRPSHLFHTLCITPDTLAFNAHGNVCFMEQLSDDPEGSFVPPEFDSTGSTFEGHVYSLGSTLSAALNFVIEPELEAELGEEMQKLLEQMQEEKPEDRPLLQDVLSLALTRLSDTSSTAVCRKLSSVGRRVLSIESVSTFQDGQQGTWEARWQHSKPRCLLKRLSSDDATDDSDEFVRSHCLSRQQVCAGWDSTLWAEDLDSTSGRSGIMSDALDCRSFNNSPVRRRVQQKPKGALNRSCSVPDSNNPPCPSPPTPGDISIPVSDLTEIGTDEHSSCASMWSSRLQRLERGLSCDPDYLSNSTSDTQTSQENLDATESACQEDTSFQADLKISNQDLTYSSSSCLDCDSPVDQRSLNNLYDSNNFMTKSMLCLNEESQDEWISLREVLTRSGLRLTVNELWALCYTCLSSLQTYIDFPAYLCLDTVFVGCEGEMLFLRPKNLGSRDDFFLAPEYQEHGIVTEKACVYGVAAILWAAAKFSLSPCQKLAIPHKLKRLLLEMAKRTPMERPSIITAKKCCRDYLTNQGTSAEAVWSELICRVHPPTSRAMDGEVLTAVGIRQSSSEESVQSISGFVPMATESRLAPVPGPVPYSCPAHEELRLPEAFTSSATHFAPIILTCDDQSGEDRSLGDAIEEVVDGFTHRFKHMEDASHHFAVNTEADVLTEVPVHPPLVNSTFMPSDDKASFISASAPDISRLSVSPLSSNLISHSVFSNYLFCQHPTTGRLSLVPIQVQAPKSFPGLEINLSLSEQALQGLITNPEGTDGAFIACQSVLMKDEPRIYTQPSPCFKDSSSIFDSSPLSNTPTAYDEHTIPRSQVEITPESGSSGVVPALQEVIDLLKGEFSLNSRLDNEHQESPMGEYIFSLKDLPYQVFASVVKERFCHLYWEEDLLGVLHCLVNHSQAKLDSNKPLPSEAEESAETTRPSSAAVCEGNEDGCLHGCLDLNGNIQTVGPSAVDTRERRYEPTSHPEEEDVLRPELRSQPFYQGTERVGSNAGVMEAGEHSTGGSDESPSEAEYLSGGEAELCGSQDLQTSPACSEEMEDSDSLVSERLLSPGFRAEGPGLSFSPAWALALYGEDYFNQDVVKYAVNLGQHTGTPGLDVKTQELQQQLIIETRNLKRTRNFYQKLIQQERKNKGCESKVMLSKLKSQLEELRSKVVFLDSVKRYLEIQRIDQCGLDVSLLPSHVATQSEESLALSFGTREGKSALQAGTPLGLMTYLYARNAAVEGYIQQFLYTFRFFCTPDQLLQFIMETYSSAARDGPDVSGDSSKILHRSLDLLHLWITDCKQVDFPVNSGLLNELEDFLNTEVIPIDSRGEVILTALHSSPSDNWSKEQDGLIRYEEDDDSLKLYSSPEELGRRWRFSKVVEPSTPKDKSFSIAAALPVPCYSSLLDDLSNVCLPSDERIPFSQKDCSVQHVAQQLTLLQQELFQKCHPVHFLNSRTQGVGNKAVNPTKNASHHLSPVEGGSAPPSESDCFLPQLLSYADKVANWISGELVICDSVKTQVALLSKYLCVGKHCYESRNFATAMQVLRGLENVIVKQLPAWKHLSTKVLEILEELQAVQVFLKSDDLCLMGGEHRRRRPTLPAAHILAMHVQQLEIGAFALTSGAYKWTKLKGIAKVVSQVHAFQETAFPYKSDWKLQAYLRHRIAQLGNSDIHLLAAGNNANVQQSTERQTKKIQDTLRRVKATFQ
ncbi:kinase non-catalytic C-lobe domain-containing protein 1 [Synchiropus picturatus]